MLVSLLSSRDMLSKDDSPLTQPMLLVSLLSRRDMLSKDDSPLTQPMLLPHSTAEITFCLSLALQQVHGQARAGYQNAAQGPSIPPPCSHTTPH